MTDEQKPAPTPAPKTEPAVEPDAIDESSYEIDEELNSVATTVGTLGNPGLVEGETREVGDNIDEGAVATEVGVLGWPEGAENEQGTAPDGTQVEDDADPSWTVQEALPEGGS